MRLRNDLQREHDRKLQEMKEASRRMKEDCDHQIELERYSVCGAGACLGEGELTKTFWLQWIK